MLERCVTLVETAALLGPASLLGLVAADVVSGLLFGWRLLSRGYYRCLFSSK